MLVERSQLIAWLINNCLIYGPMCVMEGSQQHPAQILWSLSPIGRRRVSHSTGTSVTRELSLGPLKPALENNIHLLMGTWPWGPILILDCSFKKNYAWKEAVTFIEVWAELKMQDQGVAFICDADQYFHFKDLLYRRHMTICKINGFWGAGTPE